MMELIIGLLLFGIGVLLFRYLDKKSDAWIESGNRYKRVLGWCLLFLLTIGLPLYLIVTQVQSCSTEHNSNQSITNTF